MPFVPNMRLQQLCQRVLVRAKEQLTRMIDTKLDFNSVDG